MLKWKLQKQKLLKDDAMTEFYMIYYSGDKNISSGYAIPFHSQDLDKFKTMADMFNIGTYIVKNSETSEVVYKSDRYKELETAETKALEEKDSVNAERLKRLNAQLKVFFEGFNTYRFEVHRGDYDEKVFKHWGRTVSSYLTCFIVKNNKDFEIKIENYISENNRILFSSWKKWNTTAKNELADITQDEFKRMAKFYTDIRGMLNGIAYGK